jgi:hypothetical protein
VEERCGAVKTLIIVKIIAKNLLGAALQVKTTKGIREQPVIHSTSQEPHFSVDFFLFLPKLLLINTKGI